MCTQFQDYKKQNINLLKIINGLSDDLQKCQEENNNLHATI